MIEPITTKPRAVASSIGLTGNVGKDKCLRSLVRCNFADFVADPNSAAAHDLGIPAAKMERSTLLVVCESFRIVSIASGKFRAARVLEVGDLDDNFCSDANLTAGGQISFA